MKKIAGKKGSPPASLDGIDSDVWVDFFTNLLGKEAAPEEISERRYNQNDLGRFVQNILNRSTGRKLGILTSRSQTSKRSLIC